MVTYLIKQAELINEGQRKVADVLIKNGRIEKIADTISNSDGTAEIDGNGKYLLPGLIDDQVHFREPGLTHKGELYTEARSAVAGGITSFMEMPNTKPPALTQELLEQKYARAAEVSLANYSFFMGTSNDNYEEVMKTDLTKICGLKIFMGSSTGNMLVDDDHILAKIFANFSGLIATHCEDEATIKANMATYREKYGENVPISCHPLIRSEEACYISSSRAVALAEKFDTRLHILHISTAKETELFRNDIPLEEKRITAEACLHHLWFSDVDYAEKGTHIKWNPAVKTSTDREAVLQALKDGRIDVLATDHAPHTLEEKTNTYFNAPSGGPLAQHNLVALLQMEKAGRISLEMIVQKACHNVAIMFDIPERGYIREGYWADLVLVDPNDAWTVSKENILYKCGWSPFEGQQFDAKVTHTFVNGHLAYQNGNFNENQKGQRLSFNR